MNNIKIYIVLLLIAFCTKNSIAQTGIVVGINGFGYKSNLYNHYDFKATQNNPTLLSYIRSYGTSYGVEVGYQTSNQFIISIEPQWSSINQKYEGIAYNVDPSKVYWNFSINSQLKYIKIPLTFSKLLGSSKLKFLTSVGFDYWNLNTYTEIYNKTSPINTPIMFNTTIKNNSYEKEYIKSNYGKQHGTLSDYIYQKSIFGVHAGLGASYSLSKKFQIYSKINVEYTFGDMENKDSIDIKPDYAQSWLGSKVAPFAGSDIKYFAKEYSDPVTNERSNTHIFNLGLMIGVRFIIPQ